MGLLAVRQRFPLTVPIFSTRARALACAERDIPFGAVSIRALIGAGPPSFAQLGRIPDEVRLTPWRASPLCSRARTIRALVRRGTRLAGSQS